MCIFVFLCTFLEFLALPHHSADWLCQAVQVCSCAGDQGPNGDQVCSQMRLLHLRIGGNQPNNHTFPVIRPTEMIICHWAEQL